MKHFACSCLLLGALMTSAAAVGENIPASQFGFHGWPYRQHTAGHPGAVQPDLTPIPLPDGRGTPVPEENHPDKGPGILLPTMAPSRPSLPSTALPTAVPVSTPPASNGDYTTISVAAQEQKLLNLLNRDRAMNGLPALSLDSRLSAIARAKSEDMKKNRYFAHESPTYGNAASMLRHFGYAYHGVGENIAHHANAEKAEAAFMSSNGHRRNILGRQWEKVGIGVCVDDQGFLYVTQLFVR